MRIIKNPSISDPFSARDMHILLGEMFNIMVGKRIFDLNGEFIGKRTVVDDGAPPDPPNIDKDRYLSVIVDEKNYCIEDYGATMGFVILPAGSKDYILNCKQKFEDFCVDMIPRYEEKYLAGTPHENYLSTYKSVYLDVFSSLYAKPACKVIKRNSEINNDKVNNIAYGDHRDRGNLKPDPANVKIQFRFDVGYGSNLYAVFTWHLISVNEFVFSIGNSNREYSFCSRICSVFYDASDISIFKHGERTTEFGMNHLKSSKYFITEKVNVTSKIKNPIAGELALSKKSSLQTTNFTELSKQVYEGKLEQFSIAPIVLSEFESFDNSNIDDGLYRCAVCFNTLYEEEYVCVKPGDDHHKDKDVPITNAVAICAICMHSSRNNLQSSYAEIYVVKFPMTIEEKINSLSCNIRKKDILKSASISCVPGQVVENDIIIKYYVLNNKYVVVGNANGYLLKFTRFSSISYITEGVERKILYTAENDKSLD